MTGCTPTTSPDPKGLLLISDLEVANAVVSKAKQETCWLHPEIKRGWDWLVGTSSLLAFNQGDQSWCESKMTAFNSIAHLPNMVNGNPSDEQKAFFNLKRAERAYAKAKELYPTNDKRISAFGILLRKAQDVLRIEQEKHHEGRTAIQQKLAPALTLAKAEYELAKVTLLGNEGQIRAQQDKVDVAKRKVPGTSKAEFTGGE